MELLTERQIASWKWRIRRSLRDYFFLMDRWTEEQRRNCLRCEGNCDSCKFFELQKQYCEIFGIDY